jgi:hypothetical protein
MPYTMLWNCARISLKMFDVPAFQLLHSGV